MYQLSRVMLALAMAFLAYTGVLAAVMGVWSLPPDQQGWAWAVITAVLVGAVIRRRGRRLLTACGTAAWAGAAELLRAGMLYARKGLILGRLPDDGSSSVSRAVGPLFRPDVPARAACDAFFGGEGRRRGGPLVRLPQAVHTMVVAPTGVGKGVSFVVPFLLTCDESVVCIDFKGENALLTAEHRRRMGHQIVIIDPFKVVTQ
jgi:type IV secretion system protein VirD4